MADRLNRPADFSAPGAAAADLSSVLVPPSHFTVTPGLVSGGTGVPLSRGVPSGALAQAQQEIQELRHQIQEQNRNRNQNQDQGRTELLQGDRAARSRSLDRERGVSPEAPPAGRWGQLEALRDLSAQQSQELLQRDGALCRLQQELEEVQSELSRARQQQDRLQAQQEVLTQERDRAEAELSRPRQEQDRALAQLESLRLDGAAQQAALSTAAQDSSQLRAQLLQAQQERDQLEAQLRDTGEALQEQTAAVQALRRYIGEQNPDSEQDRGHPSSALKRLQEEKDTLSLTAELLKVRLDSLSDVLALQEAELGEQPQRCVSSSPGAAVLRRWREKVFQLLVHLRSQELERRGEEQQLNSKLCTLQQEVKAERQRASLLQHSLQDRGAQLEMERLGRETAERELARVREESQRLQEQRQQAEGALVQLREALSRFEQVFEERSAALQAAESGLLGLGRRVAFASRRLDTLQGLLKRREALLKVQRKREASDPQCEPGRLSYQQLQAELSLAVQEREELRLELRRTPELIEAALSQSTQPLEAELRQLRAEAGQRAQAERRAEAELQEAQCRLEDLQGALESTRETSERLRQELSNQREESERVLQSRLREVESELQQQLREMETQLRAAKREEAQAAAALRQWERRSARDQDREQQLRALREEQHQREAQDLQRALQRAEADRSLLLATVRQEGLLSQYRRNRTAARTAPPGLERAPLERPPLAQTAPPGLERAPLERPPLAQTAPPDLERPPLAQTAPPAREDEPPLATSPGQAQALRSSSRPQQRDSLSSVLEELQVLSLAVIDSGETSSEEEGDRKAAEGSLGSVGLFTNSKA